MKPIETFEEFYKTLTAEQKKFLTNIVKKEENRELSNKIIRSLFGDIPDNKKSNKNDDTGTSTGTDTNRKSKKARSGKVRTIVPSTKVFDK